MEKVCDWCGRVFGCEQSGSCWCSEVRLAQAQQAWLGEHFTDCLCPACLNGVGLIRDPDARDRERSA